MRRHVLAVRLDSEGDVLLTGPAIRALGAGAERLTLWCGPRGRQAAQMLPAVDEVVTFEACWIDPEPTPLDPSETHRLVRRFAGMGIDAAVIFTSFHQSPLPTALLLRLAGVPFVAAISDDYPGGLLDVRHRVHTEIHEVERSLSLAEAAGFRLPPEDNGALQVRTAPAPLDILARRPYVVVHPGASVPARAWEPERHAELVEALAGRGRQVVVTGAPSERELTRFVAGAPHPRVLDAGGATGFAELAGILAAAEVVVVGNTGPAHLAAAVGTPVVSLFAPTVPAVRWRPWRVPQILLGDQEIACAGCRAKQCPIAGHPCVSTIPLTEVVAAVEHLAGGSRTRSPMAEVAR